MKIKLYNDIAFKWIFGRQEQTGPLIKFINAVICHEGDAPKFSEIKILNPYDISEPFKNEKQGILDIRAKDSISNEWVNLEVQVAYSESYPQRSKYYLAGLYRDQLEKDKESNYDELTPVYGIHVLVETLFRGKGDERFWFNHYAMLNTRSHAPLIGHWHLYYLELNKFLANFKKETPENELEQWSYFLGTIQDNANPLDNKISNNEGIKEVYDMLQTFTEDDRLREQYRLQEEFIRAQRTEQARTDRLVEQYNKEKLEKKAALKAKKQAIKAQEKERLEKEAALKAQKAALQEVKKFKRSSIQLMKQQGHTKEDIAQMLNISIQDVETYF